MNLLAEDEVFMPAYAPVVTLYIFTAAPLVSDSQGNAVINEADLFSTAEGYSAEDASVLRATVTIGSPMQHGHTYHCKVRVFDKQKAESEIVSELDFTVQ